MNAGSPAPDQSSIDSGDEATPAEGFRLRSELQRPFVAVRIFSGLSGLATVAQALFGFDLDWAAASIYVQPSAASPGGWDPSRTATLALGLLLLMGAASHVPRLRSLVLALVVAWSAMSIRAFSPDVLWLTDTPLPLEFPFEFRSTGGIDVTEFQVRPIPIILALWSLGMALSVGTEPLERTDDAAQNSD